MKFLREREVCEMIGFSRTTLWRLEKQGLLKRRRVGTSVRWLSHEVEAWMASRPSTKDQEVA